MDLETCDHLFVYGTLKSTFRNPFALRLSREAIFIAHATVPGRLYRLDWYPALILDAAAGPVSGEVWKIKTGAILNDLDRYEGAEYRRSTVPVSVGTELLSCWIYEWTGDVAGLDRIVDGVYTE